MSFHPPTSSRRDVVKITAAAGLAAWLARPLQALADEATAQEAATGEDKTGNKKPGHKKTGHKKPGDPTQQPAQEASASKSELPYFDRIGLQLYTVREALAKDPEATLQAIAKAGYFQVELMNIDDNAVKIAAMARDLGLAVHSGFLDFNLITAPGDDGGAKLDYVLELAERIGLRHVVFGYIAKDQRDTADRCRAIADRANAAAHQTREAGMRMCYHNHSFEFQKFTTGKPQDQKLNAFDIFVERFDPHQMEFELDVFGVKVGGHDPIAMMKRLAGRISQVHLKDMLKGTPVITDESMVPSDAFEELGGGVIDIPAVMRLAKEIGVETCHVEQDQSPAPLDSILQSYQFLQRQA